MWGNRTGSYCFFFLPWQRRVEFLRWKPLSAELTLNGIGPTCVPLGQSGWQSIVTPRAARQQHTLSGSLLLSSVSWVVLLRSRAQNKYRGQALCGPEMASCCQMMRIWHKILKHAVEELCLWEKEALVLLLECFYLTVWEKARDLWIFPEKAFSVVT